MKNNNKIFIFDMDGVIVNTVEALYKVYLDFLNEFQIKGIREEFDKLSGPKIEQIVSYLKQKYHLSPSEKELLIRYNQKIKSIYSKATLIDHIESVLKLLKKNNFKIALASSSKKRNIDLVLEKFNLKHYFDFIVSGDEVNKAKPSPEIYNLIKERFKNRDHYVIEDSKHGVSSALSANMQVIFFNPHKQKIDSEIAHDISKMKEMERIMEEIKVNCKTITLSSEINVKLKEHNLNITSEQELIINQIWEKEKEKNHSLFNGKIVSYKTHYLKKSKLIIECFLTEYKYFLAQLNNKNLNLNISPLAVSGIIIDKLNNTLIAKRSDKVTEYKNFYEFVPSGSIGINSISQKEVLFENQLKKEFEEETSLSTGDIKSISPFCLILDKKDNVYDICCLIRVKDNLKKLKNYVRKEYSAQQIIYSKNIERFIKKNKCVPTTITLYNILKDRSVI